MKVSSKQADATLAKLTSVMQRNTTLATNAPQQPSPVSTYTLPAKTKSPPSTHKHSRGSGIRLKSDDDAKIMEVIRAGLNLNETLNTSDVIRLALRAYKPESITSNDIAYLRAKDGRTASASL